MIEILDFFEKYAKANNWPQWIIDYFVRIAFPIVVFFTIAFWIYKIINWFRSWRIQKKLKKNLNPFFSPLDVYKSTRYYVSAKYQNVSPAEGDEYEGKYIASPQGNLSKLFLKQVLNKDKIQGKYFLILADSGMGKTSFLINLVLKYSNQFRWPWAIPRNPIKLIPLGSPHANESIKDIPNKEETILLLDAFDEDIEADNDYKSRLSELLKLTWNFRIIVMTCRTQFFPVQLEEPYETGHFTYGDQREYKFQKVYISAFSKWDILFFLLKKYKIYNPINYIKLVKAHSIIKKSQSLMVRPMLLSHIDDLVKSSKKYFYSYQIYEVLIDRWIQRESKKAGVKTKYGSIDTYSKLLYKFSKSLALDLFRKKESRGGYFISVKEGFLIDGFSLMDFDKDYLEISDIEKRSKSLLNRTADGIYKFSHRSIFEYFIAKEILDKGINYNETNFGDIDKAKVFYFEMVVDIFKTYDGFYSLGNSIDKSLSSLKVTDLNDLTKIRLLNFRNTNPDLLHCLKSLRRIEIIDSITWWFDSLYSQFNELISRFEAYKNLSIDQVKTLKDDRDWLLRLSESRNLSNQRFLKSHIEELENDTLYIINYIMSNLEADEIENSLSTNGMVYWNGNNYDTNSKEYIDLISSLRRRDNNYRMANSRFTNRRRLLKGVVFPEKKLIFSIKMNYDLLEGIESFLSEVAKLRIEFPDYEFIY